MNIFEFGKRIFGKKLDQRAAAAGRAMPRADEGLPLGAMVGGILEIPRASFALLTGSLVRVPDSAQLPIEAVSRVRLEADSDLMMHRYYTGVGDLQGRGLSFLQVIGNSDGIVDVGYYQIGCRQIPQTAEDQAAFMGRGFGLGEVDYLMAEDQLREMNLPMEQIIELLAGQDALNFKRDLDGEDYVAPLVGRETRIDDAFGQTGLTKKVRFMPYSRTLPDGNVERLLVSFDAVDSVNGVAKTRVYVNFLVGLGLDLQKVRVIGA